MPLVTNWWYLCGLSDPSYLIFVLSYHENLFIGASGSDDVSELDEESLLLNIDSSELESLSLESEVLALGVHCLLQHLPSWQATLSTISLMGLGGSWDLVCHEVSGGQELQLEPCPFVPFFWRILAGCSLNVWVELAVAIIRGFPILEKETSFLAIIQTSFQFRLSQLTLSTTSDHQAHSPSHSERGENSHHYGHYQLCSGGTGEAFLKLGVSMAAPGGAGLALHDPGMYDITVHLNSVGDRLINRGRVLTPNQGQFGHQGNISKMAKDLTV
ncbi:hypothetical protein EDC04DRAFT_2612578 [Pisolithus marmoratus]|nr:hypothetical protein EDC04DRAFT_2612578 [Pisolithus marmoratus]